MVVCVGIPLDENSSFLRGAAEAPAKIREAFLSPSANSFTENGIDIAKTNSWKDAGDLKLSRMPDAFSQIEDAIDSNLTSHHKVLSLGGDHSITYPIIKAYAKK